MLELKYHKDLIECGTDEAGRGCLAGPVTAAAVILKDDFKNKLLNDSKQLSEKNRDSLRILIEEEALCYGVSHVMMEEIDEIITKNFLGSKSIPFKKLGEMDKVDHKTNAQ